MALSTLDRAVAVGLAALSVLCPERPLAQVADARQRSQQLRALFDEDVVIASSHARLQLFPIKGNRYRSGTMAFLNISQTGRAPTLEFRFAMALAINQNRALDRSSPVAPTLRQSAESGKQVAATATYRDPMRRRT